MKKSEAFTAKKRLKSFRYAFQGLAYVVKSQHNMWIHLCVTVLVVIAATAFHIAKADWLWLIVAILIVLLAEIFNTAFEFLSDVVSEKFNPAIGKAKDIAAAAVLVAACGAIIISMMIFWPYIRG